MFGLCSYAVSGELPDEEKVSEAQMGAFFGAMTLRANAFPRETQWSEGERKALTEMWPYLYEKLPREVLFLADPEGTIMGGLSPVGPTFVGSRDADVRLVGALREILVGGHLGFEEVVMLLKDVLPRRGLEAGSLVEVSDALLAAFMICQRMNIETDRELKAYCMAFDNELGQFLSMLFPCLLCQ